MVWALNHGLIADGYGYFLRPSWPELQRHQCGRPHGRWSSQLKGPLPANKNKNRVEFFIGVPCLEYAGVFTTRRVVFANGKIDGEHEVGKRGAGKGHGLYCAVIQSEVGSYKEHTRLGK